MPLSFQGALQGLAGTPTGTVLSAGRAAFPDTVNRDPGLGQRLIANVRYAR